MKNAILCCVCCILTFTGKAQTITLPQPVFDTMVYEVQKGRLCDSLAHVQAVTLKTAQSALEWQRIGLRQAINRGNLALMQGVQWQVRYNAQKQATGLQIGRLKRQNLVLKIGLGTTVVTGVALLALSN